jgi:hypothetical protein
MEKPYSRTARIKMDKQRFQYWRGVSVGLLLTSVTFTIPIIMFTFVEWKYMGLLFLIINYAIGFLALFEMTKYSKKQKPKVKRR